MRLKILFPLGFLLVLLVSGVGLTESLLDNSLEIDMPSDFKVLSPEELKTKFPSSNRPQVAWGNEATTVTIAVKKRRLSVPEEELPEFKASMRKFLKSARPEIVFETDEIAMINGQKWIRFVFESQAVDDKIRNEMLLASKEGALYLLNLNASFKDYDKYASALEKARKSIELR